MCACVLAAAVQLQQSQLWPWWWYAAVLGLAVGIALALWRWPLLRHALVWGLLGAALGWGLTGWRAASWDAQRLTPDWEGVDVRVVGVITDVPQSMERGVRLRFTVEQVQELKGLPQAAPWPRQVVLSWYGAMPAQGLAAGQRWAWTVRWKAPHGARNPHGMDWELWQWSQGIQATGYVRTGPRDAPPQWLGLTAQAPVAQWRGRLLQAMQAPAAASAREQASWGVVQALVTGAQSRIEHADWQLFRDTGVAHLVSISGLHITMFAWLAIAVVQWLWRRMPRACLVVPAPVAAAWLGLALAAAYAVFSGWGIPAQRTVGMLALVVGLRHQARAWPWPMVWLMVLTAVVLLDPWSLLQAGFWLSFVAVGVLFAAQPGLRQSRTGSQRWRAAGRQLLREQAIVGVALAPLTLLLFGQVSVVGMLANLWAIPWVTLVVTPLSMLGAAWPALWSLAAYSVSVMVQVLQWMQTWPVAVLYFAQPAPWAAAAGVLGALWMVLPLGWRWRLLGLPAVLPMLLWVPAVPAWGEFSLLALDVGQGSAVLLRTQQHSLLFDAGPRWSAHSDAGERVVVPVLRALGVQPTVMMLSHGDADHAGGAGAVQRAFPALLWQGAGGDPCVRGQAWSWEGVTFRVLHPSQSLQGRAARNADSCVLLVESATGRRVVLTGDIGAAQEQWLVQNEAAQALDVLLVPHHGSASSSSRAFVAHFRPALAVVQAGYRNRFGHPASAVLARYQGVGAEVVSTPVCGAFSWHSQRPQQWQCERSLHRRYWQHRPMPASTAPER